jgi:hypothetical protein
VRDTVEAALVNHQHSDVTIIRNHGTGDRTAVRACCRTPLLIRFEAIGSCIVRTLREVPGGTHRGPCEDQVKALCGDQRSGS